MVRQRDAIEPPSVAWRHVLRRAVSPALAVLVIGCAGPSPATHARITSRATASSVVVAPSPAVPAASARGDATIDSASVSVEAPAAPAGAPPPALEPISVAVPRDKRVWVVPGETSTPIVYLHGRCGDPHAFVAWAQVGRRFGTIISLTGDIKCKVGSRTQWTEDIASIDRRVTAAIAAARAELGIEIDGAKRIVVGYSQGSLKAEALASRFPDRYPRAVLIAGPRGPRDESLRKTEAILFMVGDHDARDHLREATRKLEKRGKTVRYLELRGARHGEYGPDAEKTVAEGLEWLFSTPSRLQAGGG